MPNDKSELAEKWVLIDKAKQLLDLLYPEADGKADEAIQRFRDGVLQRLDQLRNISYADEIKILTDFLDQLISILIEAGNQTILSKDNVGNETLNIFNINSNNLAHENAEFKFDKIKIILGPTYNIDLYHNENKTEQPALSDQKESLALLYERFSSFYAARKVKRTFGESEEGEVFDDLYTRLALIREREVKEDRERSRKDLNSLKQMPADRIARDEHLHLFEHILYTERKPIEEDQLFLPVSDDAMALRQKGRIDRILIRGQAGVGKTTFCYHLARKLIEQHHWVWVIPLRYLRDVTEKLTDVDVIMRALEIELTQEEIALLTQLLVDKTQKAYWLLDGYDEVANLPTTHPIQQWLTKAFHNKERVIVTTRPRAVKEFEADRQIEMIGYLPENVERYVTRYFGKQSEKSNTVMTFIKQQKQLGAVHRIPIILELMCWASDDLMVKQGSNTIPFLFTDLYMHVLQCLNRRYLMKNSELKSLADEGTDKEIEEALRQSYLDPLLELAYQTFITNQLIFTGQDVVCYLSLESSDARAMVAPANKGTLFHILKVFFQLLWHLAAQWFTASRRKETIDRTKILYEFGLVRCLRDVGSFDRNEFTFIHLTAQEFLMAKRWVQLFTSGNSNDITCAVNLFTGRKEKGYWVKSHKYDKRFEVVWGFVAGLLRSQSEHLQRFLDLIAEAPRDQIGSRHISLLLQVVGEANCLKEDTREYEEIAAWLSNKGYRYLGFRDYASILARYPVVVSVLQKEWDKLWRYEEEEHDRGFIVALLSILQLDEKSEIYRDLLRELETESIIDMEEYTAARALGNILLTEVQQEQVVCLLCSRLQDTYENDAQEIINALGNIYSRRSFTQAFPSNLFDSLFACIREWDDIGIINTARVLGTMDLPEEKRLSILDTLLARWHQAQFESSSNATKEYIIAALGSIPIPEKRQVEITRFLLDRINDKSDHEGKLSALDALSQINLPVALRWEVIDTFLNHLGDSDWRINRAVVRGFGRIFILLREQDQAQVMETLLTHLKGNHRKKKRASFAALRGMKIAKNYQTSVLDALWDGLHDSDNKVKKYAAKALVGMNIPAAMQPQFIDALLDGLKTSSLSKAMVETLGAILIPEQLKSKVRDTLFNRFSQFDEDDYFPYLIVSSLGRIGIPQKLGKKIIEITYARDNKGLRELNELNFYCLILDDDLPRYLREVSHTFVFDSVDAETVHLAGTFNNWLNASDGKIDSRQYYNWEMVKYNERRWELTICLLPGSYEFNYIIDHGRRWETDPNYPLSVNDHSKLKIEPRIRRTNKTNGNNTSLLTTVHSIDSHIQILSRLRSNSNNASTMTASSLPSKQAVDNEIVLSDAEEAEVIDATKASEEEDATTDMTHTMER